MNICDKIKKGMIIHTKVKNHSQFLIIKSKEALNTIFL